MTEYAKRRGKLRWRRRPRRTFTTSSSSSVISLGRSSFISSATAAIQYVRSARIQVPVGGRQTGRYGHSPPLNVHRELAGGDADGMRWRGHPQYHEVRYEDIVNDPEPVLRRVCEFIGEEWTPGLWSFMR